MEVLKEVLIWILLIVLVLPALRKLSEWIARHRRGIGCMVLAFAAFCVGMFLPILSDSEGDIQTVWLYSLLLVVSVPPIYLGYLRWKWYPYCEPQRAELPAGSPLRRAREVVTEAVYQVFPLLEIARASRLLSASDDRTHDLRSVAETRMGALLLLLFCLWLFMPVAVLGIGLVLDAVRLPAQVDVIELCICTPVVLVLLVVVGLGLVYGISTALVMLDETQRRARELLPAKEKGDE